MSAYYNEIDPFAAEWLRQLIKAGHIADGVVDERSIEDIKPNELKEFTQCHFFAGIGVWSYALRQAGWPDDRPIWTGSCPCQPFSTAGKGKGVDDERHLWPAFHWLIKQCRPSVVLGEQVAGKAGMSWFDIVSTDLEGEGYTCGPVVFPACGVGAPHQRQRQYWVGEDSLAHTQSIGKSHQSGRVGEAAGASNQEARGEGGNGDAIGSGVPNGKLAHANDEGPQGHDGDGNRSDQPGRVEAEPAGSTGTSGGSGNPGPTNGHWRDVDWLGCRDGKWRPVEPGTFPLVDGAPARVGRLRGYGNAIVGPQAQAFIEAVCEALTEQNS